MKKTLFLTIVFCAVFMYLPFGAQAEDANVSLIVVNVNDGTIGATANYTCEIEVVNSLSSGDSINLLFSEDGTFTPHGGFNLSGAEFSSTGVYADLTIEPVGDGSLRLDLTADLAVGGYIFNLDNIVNTSTVGTYNLEVSTGGVDFSYDTFEIAEATNPFSIFSYSSNSLVSGGKTNVSYGLTITDSLVVGDSFYLVYATDGDVPPEEIGFDLSNSVFTSSDMTLTCGGVPDASVVLCAVGADVSAGSYTINATKVINAEVGNYRVGITDEQPSATANYTFSEWKAVFDLGKLKKKKVKVKELSSGKLRVKAKKRVAGSNWFKTKLLAKKSSKVEASASKKWKKIKTFRYKKKIKKIKKKFVDDYITYKVKLYSCYRYKNKKGNEICGSPTIKNIKMN